MNDRLSTPLGSQSTQSASYTVTRDERRRAQEGWRASLEKFLNDIEKEAARDAAKDAASEDGSSHTPLVAQDTSVIGTLLQELKPTTTGGKRHMVKRNLSYAAAGFASFLTVRSPFPQSIFTVWC